MSRIDPTLELENEHANALEPASERDCEAVPETEYESDPPPDPEYQDDLNQGISVALAYLMYQDDLNQGISVALAYLIGGRACGWLP